MEAAFYQSESDQPHPGRARTLIKAHPEVRQLMVRNPGWNKMVAVIADLPNLTPGAMGFRVYHLKHHSHQGDYEWDADLANHWEARLVGNKWYRKAIWLMLFPFFQ